MNATHGWVLVALLALPFAGGVAAWLAARSSATLARWTALATMIMGLVVVGVTWIAYSGDLFKPGQPWLEWVSWPWVPQIGISFSLAMDGLSLIMVALCYLLGLVSVIVSWREIGHRVGFFHFHLLWSISGLVGAFLAMDLFLFYFLFEVMLVPMYFLIAIWGHERRIYSAVKFFIFTQAGGLLMLVAILALYFVHGGATGDYTFNYFELLGTSMSSGTAMWIMLGFFAAFAVKLPALPLHSWLPDAHTEAPTAGSIILAGVLIKVGAYGMLRFQIPLFPQAAETFQPIAMWLGVAGILYGAVLAFSQRDLKRMVAYTSVSHMGFVLLGIFAWNGRSLQGVMLEIVCHALSTGGLFVIVGQIQERTGTRDLRELGGAWSAARNMGGAAMIFALASLGLPGLGNFVAEFLILSGSFSVNRAATAVAMLGLVVAVIYAIWLFQKVFHGAERRGFADLSVREVVVVTLMVAPLLILGLYPRPVLGTSASTLRDLQPRAAQLSESVPPVTAPPAVVPGGTAAAGAPAQAQADGPEPAP